MHPATLAIIASAATMDFGRPTSFCRKRNCLLVEIFAGVSRCIGHVGGGAWEGLSKDKGQGRYQYGCGGALSKDKGQGRHQYGCGGASI